MSSDEEFYVVEEILNQRRRRGVVEYLVRWEGFSHLYDSWEPASGVGHCTQLIKAFLDKKKRSRSKSRSRSRGRAATKSRSKSRSRSRGRAVKSTSTPSRSRSRSRSTSRTVSQSSPVSRLAVKKEPSLAKDVKSWKLRQREQVPQQKTSLIKTEMFSANAAIIRGSRALEREAETVTKAVETVRSVPGRMHPTTTAHSQLVVRRVENDLKPSSRGQSSGNGDGETWWWWLADYITLAVFIIVSILALSFAVGSLSGLNEKLVPDFTGLRNRIWKNYNDRLQDLRKNYNDRMEDIYGILNKTGRMEEIKYLLNQTGEVVSEGLRTSRDAVIYVAQVIPIWGDDPPQNQAAENSTRT